MMTLAQAQAMLPGAQLVGDARVRFARVHTDTRSLRTGDLFVALKGERFDAHDFLRQAGTQGAVAALAEQGLAEAGLPGLQVANSKAALGQLAAGWRAQFKLPLVAVTGSNGKTTVTQMIAAILRNFRGEQAFATEGNFNNDIGVPLTLLRLRASHQAGVVELGMNHPGEIAELAAMAQATVALVNNAQREHLEFMITVEAVARENGAVISALADDGVAVFPADDAHTPIWRALAGARRTITFALDRGQLASESYNTRWRTGVCVERGRSPQRQKCFGCGCLCAGRRCASGGDCRRAHGFCARQGPLACMATFTGRPAADGGGRQLQRQSRFGACRYPGAQRTAGAPPAGPGRHG